MKRTLLLLVCIAVCAGLEAQVDSAYIYQQFNINDSSSFTVLGVPYYNHFPPGWTSLNTYGVQTWHWEHDYGVNNGPCMHINGYIKGSGNQVDTAYLISPYINLAPAYADSATVKLGFTGTYAFPGGDSIHVLLSTNYVIGNNPDNYTWTELAHTPAMALDTFYYAGVSPVDSEYPYYFTCDLTPYKTTSRFVIAFKYTSSLAGAEEWNLDSVETLPLLSPAAIAHLGVNNISAQQLSLQVIGFSTANNIEVSYDVAPGAYTMSLFDMTGRKVYSRAITAGNGNEQMTIDDADLRTGIYVLMLSNGNNYGIAKFLVH